MYKKSRRTKKRMCGKGVKNYFGKSCLKLYGAKKSRRTVRKSRKLSRRKC